MPLDLRHQVLFGQDLTGKDLYKAEISVECATFDGVKLDSNQVALFLLMLAQADTDSRWATGIHALVKSIVGQRRFDTMLQILKVIE